MSYPNYLYNKLLRGSLFWKIYFAWHITSFSMSDIQILLPTTINHKIIENYKMYHPRPATYEYYWQLCVWVWWICLLRINTEPKHTVFENCTTQELFDKPQTIWLSSRLNSIFRVTSLCTFSFKNNQNNFMKKFSTYQELIICFLTM